MTKHQQFVVVEWRTLGWELLRTSAVNFPAFWRAEARARRIEGSGLAIAQLIVQQHGGKITVSSQVGLVAASRCCRLVLIFLDDKENALLKRKGEIDERLITISYPYALSHEWCHWAYPLRLAT